MSLRAARRQSTQRRILAAARDLFLAQGVAATTMDQLAEAAGVSRASLFNYYPGKAALLESLGSELESRLLQAMQHYRSKHPAAPEALAALFAHAAQVLEQTAALTRLLLAQSGGGYPALLAACVDFAAEGQAAGHWRRDIEAPRLGEIIYLEFMAGLLDWCRPSDASHRELFHSRTDALNRLLAAPG